MTKTGAAIIAGTAILALAGCGADSGTIVSKEIKPAHYVWTTQCRTANKVTTCTPIQQYVPECREIRVDSGDDIDSECVSAETFDRVKVGDYWTAD